MINKKAAFLMGYGLMMPLLFGTMVGCGSQSETSPVTSGRPPDLISVDSKGKPVGKSGQIAQVAYAAMDKNCGACHGADQQMNRKVPLDRASTAQLIAKKLVVPGKPDASRVYTAMLDKEELMPPPGVQPRPSAAEIAAIRLWIAKGAPAPSQQ